MAGRPRVVKSLQSYIANSDRNSGIGNLKAGTSPSIGKTHYLWQIYSMRCSNSPNDLLANYQAPYQNKTMAISMDKSGGYSFSRIDGKFRIN